MKKLFTLTLMLLIGTGFIFSQNITIIQPNGGELTEGTSYVIKWNAAGTTNGFKITLWRSGSLVGILKSEKSAGNGIKNFNWKVGYLENGSKVNFGSGYKVKVKEKNTAVADESDNEFKIKEKASLSIIMPKISKESVIKVSDLKVFIKVTFPEEGGKYEGGKPLTITWNKNFVNNSSTQVKISLHDAKNMNKLEDISPSHPNNGSFQWNPPSKYSWPGSEYVIYMMTTDQKFDGKSGSFSIFAPKTDPPPPPKEPTKKVIAISPVITNKKTENHTNSGQAECLSMGMSIPGRNAVSKELKTGHWKMKEKGVKCDWSVNEYYFYSNLDFDISPAASKKIIRAELMITLSGTETNIAPGPVATNEYCNSESLIFRKNKYLKSFSIFEEGKSVKINLLDSVKEWSALNQVIPHYTIDIKGKLDYVTNQHSICLRYYMSPILFVEYEE